jgi:3',5'-nucleoside bisphosphate phosphatase
MIFGEVYGMVALAAPSYLQPRPAFQAIHGHRGQAATLMRIDLHVHTTASDGLLEPGAVVQAARAAGVDLLSITDHDTVDGLAEARSAAQACGLALVDGIELSAYWGKVEFHILGYFIDPADPALVQFLKSTREARHVRMHAMLSRLQAMGLGVAADAVFSRAREGNVGRPHLARALVERGFVKSTDEAFDRYLGNDRPAFVPRPDVSTADAIRVIRQAGGVASLAHPGLYNRDDALPDLMAAGLQAIEVYHPQHGFGKFAHYRSVAKRYRLLVTGGSDFHGASEGDHAAVPGNPCLPEHEYARLREALGGSPASGPVTGSEVRKTET